jgi:regulator of sigma E protease
VRVAGLGPDESTTVGAAERPAVVAGPRWQRALILLAGPAMNFALAISLQAGIFMAGRRVPAYRLEPPVIQSIVAGSPGALAGFRKGDRIVSIDGSATPTWQEAEFDFSVAPRQRLAVEIERDGRRQTIAVVPRAVSSSISGSPVSAPRSRPGGARPPHPAGGEAGLKAGDLIVSIAERRSRPSPR